MVATIVMTFKFKDSKSPYVSNNIICMLIYIHIDLYSNCMKSLIARLGHGNTVGRIKDHP